MYKKYPGFTLIELVIVIVILGILAAVAIPQFIDLSGDAKAAALAGVAGALSSANSINYAVRNESITKGVAVTNCTNLTSAMAGGALPGSQYVITPLAVGVGAQVTCTIGNGTTTTSFFATGIN